MTEVIFDALICDPFQPTFDISHPTFRAWTRGVSVMELVADLPRELASVYQLGKRPRTRQPSLNQSANNPVPRRDSSDDDSSDSDEMLASPPSGSPRHSESSDSDKQSNRRKRSTRHNNQSVDRSNKQSMSAAYNRLLQAATYSMYNQFRIYSLLEPSFRKPSLLTDRLSLAQITDSEVSELCHMYYDFDCAFMRELMGEKISKMTRNEVEVIGSKQSIRPLSSSRQWENLRRLYRSRWNESNEAFDVMEDEQTKQDVSGRLRSMIGAIHNVLPQFNQTINSPSSEASNQSVNQTSLTPAFVPINLSINQIDETAFTLELFASYYRLPISMARQYLYTIFLCHARVQCSGKRLSLVSYDDMMAVASIITRSWCITAVQQSVQQSGAYNQSTVQSGSSYVLPSPNAAARATSWWVSQSNNQSIERADTVPSLTMNRQSSADELINQTNNLTINQFTLQASPSQLAPSLAIQTDLSVDGPSDDEPFADVLDTEFLIELRSVKLHLVDQRRLLDEYTNQSIHQCRDQSNKVRSRLPATLRSFCMIAISIAKQKKIRSMLTDLTDLICKPALKLAMSWQEFDAMIQSIDQSFQSLQPVSFKLQQLTTSSTIPIVPLPFMNSNNRSNVQSTNSLHSLAQIDEATVCYVNWQRFLRVVVPVTGILYKAMHRSLAS